MKRVLNVALMVGFVAGVSTGCESMQAQSGHGASGKMVAVVGGEQLVAVMRPTLGNTVSGVVRFAKAEGGILVTAKITGLAPGTTHAIHVHQYGDATDPSGKSAGGHYNPEGHDHALPSEAMRHAGDLGNLKADANGHASYSVLVKNISLTGKNAVVGHGVIIHAKADDGGQPTGNAGPRISIGVIGYAKTK